jgi:hypothetical protein
VELLIAVDINYRFTLLLLLWGGKGASAFLLLLDCHDKMKQHAAAAKASNRNEATSN